MFQKLSATPVCIYSGGIAYVITIRLEPTDHRILAVEEPIMRGFSCARVERAVIADFVSPAGGRSRVKAVPAVAVVRLPGRIGGLEKEVRVATVVAHNKHDVTRTGHTALAHKFGDIDSG